MTFKGKLLLAGKTATGFVVPDKIVAALGNSKRPAVRVTINGYTYRNTIAVMGGKFMLGVSAEHRAGAGVSAGDELDVEVELDTAPREIEVPEDLSAALTRDTKARTYFEALSYSKQRGLVDPINGAKTAETRQRRIEKVVAACHDGTVS